MRLSGSPSKRSRKIVRPVDDHAAIGGPQRRDRNAGARHDLGPASVGAQPRPARAAERQHGRVGRARVTTPGGVSNVSAPSSSQPVQRWRGLNTTPAASSRLSQARNSGDAFRLFGNTRPLDPTKVSWPSPSHHARSHVGRERLDRIAQARRRSAVAREERVERFAVREIEPAAAGQQELPPGRRHAVVDRDPRAAAAQAPRRPSARPDRRRQPRR